MLSAEGLRSRSVSQLDRMRAVSQQCISWSVQVCVVTIIAAMPPAPTGVGESREDFDIRKTLEKLYSWQKGADQKDADQKRQLADQKRKLADQGRQLADMKRKLAEMASRLSSSEVSSCCCYPGILHCPLRTGYLSLLLGIWCMCRTEINGCVPH